MKCKVFFIYFLMVTMIFSSLKNYQLDPISFRNIPLGDALAIISEESGITIITDEKSREKKIDVHFPQRKSLDSVLSVIAQMSGLTLSRIDDTSYILKVGSEKNSFVAFGGEVQKSPWKEGIDGVKITLIHGDNPSTTTHSGGKFLFNNIEKGVYLIKMEKEGYETKGEFINISSDKSNYIGYLEESESKLDKYKGNSLNIGSEKTESGLDVVTERFLLLNILSDDAKILIEEMFKEKSTIDFVSDMNKNSEKSDVKSEEKEEGNILINENKIDKYNTNYLENLKISSLPKQNTLIITTKREKMEVIKSLLKEIDKEVKQVRIQAEVLDVTDSLFESLGFNWLYSKGGIESSKKSVGGSLISNIKETTLEISNFFKSKSEFLNFSLDLLKGREDAIITSVPSILILSGEKGEFEITDEEVVSYSSQITSSSGNTVKTYSANIDKAGTILKVLPTVKEDNKIYLKIEVEVSGFQKSGSTIDPEKGEVNPKYTRKLSSTVVVDNGDTIFIGGMKKTKSSTKTNEVPGLSAIPVAGILFKNKSSSSEVTDLYIKLRVDITNLKEDVEKEENKSEDLILLNF